MIRHVYKEFQLFVYLIYLRDAVCKDFLLTAHVKDKILYDINIDSTNISQAELHFFSEN